jgi:hypothetical protein
MYQIIGAADHVLEEFDTYEYAKQIIDSWWKNGFEWVYMKDTITGTICTK